MPEAAVAPAPQPVTVVVADQAKLDTAARDAADAKAWESITGAEPDGNDIPAPPDFAKLEAEGKTTDAGRGPDGKFVKGEKKTAAERVSESDKVAEQPESEPSIPSQKPSDKKPEAKKDDKPPLDRDQRRKILAAKEVVGRVLKYSDDEIEAMEPERLIDLSLRLKPVFNAFEDQKKDLQKWKDRARGQKPTDTDTPDNGRGRTAEPVDKAEPQPAERDTEGGSDQLLRDYLDPETFSQVKKAQRAERVRFQDQATKAEQRAEAAEAQLRSAESLFMKDRLDAARERVAEEFPQLKDDERYFEVVKVMDQMDPDEFHSRDSLAEFTKFMRKVARSEFYEDMERTTRQRLITGNRKDANNQPETTSHGSQPVAMSWDDYENYAAWAAIEAGGNSAKMQGLMARVKRPARPK